MHSEEYSGYTSEQMEILNNIDEMETLYSEQGRGLLTVPENSSSYTTTEKAKGSWSWRDGLICVTESGFGSSGLGTWHTGIVAPQRVRVVAEAPGKGKKVSLTPDWYNKYKHTPIYQVAVNSTSVKQDYNAGYWAGQQVGKAYNTNFWNSKQINIFYCSQLVWAAYYYTAGVDLNKKDNDSRTNPNNIAIHPGEFVNNPKTTVVFRNR